MIIESPAAAPEAARRSLVDRLLGRVPGVGEHAATWGRALSAFAIRVASAGLMFVTQVLLARWMGSHEFGVYVYAWTLVLIIGDLVPLGFMFAAQRFIPQYRHTGEDALLRGFLHATKVFVWTVGTVGAVAAIVAIHYAGDWLGQTDPVVVTIAVAALPAYAAANLLDGVARSYDHVNLALVPPFIGRPVMVVLIVAAAHLSGFGTDATTAMTAAVVATWVTTAVQAILVERRLAAALPAGPREYRFRSWMTVSLQIFGSWSCIVLFTYADVIVLNAFSTPDKVAIYYAASKTLALTSFITYAVSSVFGHKFVERHVAGDKAGLEQLVASSVTATFWPSLAVTIGLLLVGRHVLALFGPDFAIGYDLLFILSIGLMARAAIGPAERLLNMLGEQNRSAMIYAGALAATVALAVLLVPTWQLHGAAVAVSGGAVVEAILLAWTVRRRLGLDCHILAAVLRRRPTRETP